MKMENATITVDWVVLGRIISQILLAVEKYKEVAHEMYFCAYADAEIRLAELGEILGEILHKFQDMGILTLTFWEEEEYESEEDQEDEIMDFTGVM